MVFDHTPEHPSQWAAIRSVGEKLGIRTESLRRWVRQAERDAGTRPGRQASFVRERRHRIVYVILSSCRLRDHNRYTLRTRDTCHMPGHGA
jgi:transposase-like protein